MFRTSKLEVGILLRALGAVEGDVVLVHSSLVAFGILEGGPAGFHQALRSAIGPEGTIVVPTFTYSFRRNEIYDVRNTPPARSIGAYPEYVRRQPGAIRSLDPLFSMAAEGPEAVALMRRETQASFGERSIYERLFARNILILGVGITYSTGISPFMHLERLAEVPYRHELPLEGVTIGYDGERFSDRAVHFARKDGIFAGARTNRDAVGARMEEAGVSKAIAGAINRHMGLRAQPFAHFVLDELKKNPTVMLEQTR